MPNSPGCCGSPGTLALTAAEFGADWRRHLAESAWAQHNAVAQPLLTGLSIAGVFGSAEAVGLATERAAAMDRSATGRETGLLAVHGLDAAALGAACALGPAQAAPLRRTSGCVCWRRS
jgi:hypothetical protein